MNRELLNKLGIKKNTAIISPHVDERDFNFNLEKQGMVIFPNSKHMVYVSSYYSGNKEIFITGLDENNPKILQLPYEERIEAIRKIRLVASEIEKYNYNHVDPDDPDFWFKVKHARSDNAEIWGDLNLVLTNENIMLDLLSYDGFLKYWVALSGGFSEVAPSYEHIITGDKKYKYYLKDVERITMIAVNNVVTFNRAIRKLDELYASSSNHQKLFYISKYLTSEGFSFNSTNYSPDACMLALDKYVKGKDPAVRNQDYAIKEFMDLTDKGNMYLYAMNVVKGLITIGRIKFVDKTNNYFCLDNNMNVGRNIKEITEYFMIAENFDYLNTLCSMYGNQFGLKPMEIEQKEKEHKEESENKIQQKETKEYFEGPEEQKEELITESIGGKKGRKRVLK